MDIKTSTFANNRARSYGGVFALWTGTTATITSCVLEKNEAELGGGGIYLLGSSATVASTAFLSNADYAGIGGGLRSDKSTLVLYDSTFHMNNAQYGGAIGLLKTTGSLASCVFIGNTAESGAGSSIGMRPHLYTMYKHVHKHVLYTCASTSLGTCISTSLGTDVCINMCADTFTDRSCKAAGHGGAPQIAWSCLRLFLTQQSFLCEIVPRIVHIVSRLTTYRLTRLH